VSRTPSVASTPLDKQRDGQLPAVVKLSPMTIEDIDAIEDSIDDWLSQIESRGWAIDGLGNIYNGRDLEFFDWYRFELSLLKLKLTALAQPPQSELVPNDGVRSMGAFPEKGDSGKEMATPARNSGLNSSNPWTMPGQGQSGQSGQNDGGDGGGGGGGGGGDDGDEAHNDGGGGGDNGDRSAGDGGGDDHPGRDDGGGGDGDGEGGDGGDGDGDGDGNGDGDGEGGDGEGEMDGAGDHAPVGDPHEDLQRRGILLPPDPETGSGSGRGGNDVGGHRLPTLPPVNLSGIQHVLAPASPLPTKTGPTDEEEPDVGQMNNGAANQQGSNPDDLGDDVGGRQMRRRNGNGGAEVPGFWEALWWVFNGPRAQPRGD
jgi:hypothetical protein